VQGFSYNNHSDSYFGTICFICNGGNLIIFFQIFAGIFPKNYEPPPGDFYFEVDAESPVVQVNWYNFSYPTPGMKQILITFDYAGWPASFWLQRWTTSEWFCRCSSGTGTLATHVLVLLCWCITSPSCIVYVGWKAISVLQTYWIRKAVWLQSQIQVWHSNVASFFFCVTLTFTFHAEKLSLDHNISYWKT
jgi:hypothetical protein